MGELVAVLRANAPDAFRGLLSEGMQKLRVLQVCDQEGICRVVRGMRAAQHLIEDTPSLSATKTRLYPAEWS